MIYTVSFYLYDANGDSFTMDTPVQWEGPLPMAKQDNIKFRGVFSGQVTSIDHEVGQYLYTGFVTIGVDLYPRATVADVKERLKRLDESLKVES